MNPRDFAVSKDFKEAAFKIRCEEQFRRFAYHAWHVIDGAPLLSNWHVDAICDHLQACEDGHIDRLVINVPPGLGKSMFCSVIYPPWVWTTKPHMRFLTGSYGGDSVNRDCLKAKQLILSEWYQNNWADVFHFEKDELTFYINDKHGHRYGFTIKGQLTAHRGDRIILDDPLNYIDASYPNKVEMTNQIISQGLTTRLNLTGRTVIIMIMQRLSPKDPTGFQIARDNKWEHLYLPNEFEPDNRCVTKIFRDPRETKNELLWPAIITEEVTRQKKADLGKSGYEAQYQQRPTIEEGEILKRKHWRYYRELPPNLAIYFGLDSAHEEGKENDFSVWIILGKHGENYYILHMVRQKLTYPDLKNKNNQLLAQWRPMREFVENKSSGIPLAQELDRTVYKNIIEPINPKGDKTARAHSITPILEAGNLLLPEEDGIMYKDIRLTNSWVPIFLDETAEFPKGDHDDIVDALTLPLNALKVAVLPGIKFI
jgi:predicted phage terminase large subunit-like protein